MTLVRCALALLSVASLVRAQAVRQSSAGEAPLPPPGRLIDVGGWRLHLNCTGQASPSQPTVILEAGIGDFSVEWSLVQPKVASFARVCSYDRAGDGWSDLGPYPRTMRQIVYELHTLLEKAGERPPFVLVGHSYGGWLVRLYQEKYPAEVAGMVLVEAGADDPWRMTANGSLVRSSSLVTDRPIPPIKTSGPLSESDIPAGALSQIRSGLSQASATANEPPRDKLPPDAQRMRAWALGQVKHVVAAQNPAELEELAELRATRAKGGEHSLGDLPLVVLTRGRSDSEEPDSKMLETEHRKDHVAVAALSTRGTLVVAEYSGHHVQLDEPVLVVSAIRQVLTSARK